MLVRTRAQLWAQTVQEACALQGEPRRSLHMGLRRSSDLRHGGAALHAAAARRRGCSGPWGLLPATEASLTGRGEGGEAHRGLNTEGGAMQRGRRRARAEVADWSSWRGRRRAAPVVLVPRVDVRACCEAREGVRLAGDAPAARNCGGGQGLPESDSGGQGGAAAVVGRDRKAVGWPACTYGEEGRQRSKGRRRRHDDGAAAAEGAAASRRPASRRRAGVAGVEEARRGGAKGNGGGAPGFGVEGSSRKPERSRRGGGGRSARCVEGRSEKEEKGTTLYTPKALGTR
jgi:hypothetical protein